MAQSDVSPAERSLRSRLGAYALHAKYDSREITKPARAAFDERFHLEVDPESKLPIEERTRRATFARKAYFTKLALASAKARRQKRGGADAAA